MNGYIAFYKNKRTEVYGNTPFEAHQKAVAFFKAKKANEVNVMIAEKDGKPVVHVADF